MLDPTLSFLLISGQSVQTSWMVHLLTVWNNKSGYVRIYFNVYLIITALLLDLDENEAYASALASLLCVRVHRWSAWTICTARMKERE